MISTARRRLLSRLADVGPIKTGRPNDIYYALAKDGGGHGILTIRAAERAGMIEISSTDEGIVIDITDAGRAALRDVGEQDPLKPEWLTVLRVITDTPSDIHSIVTKAGFRPVVMRGYLRALVARGLVAQVSVDDWPGFYTITAAGEQVIAR